uniref:Uncharacterized protein n=1 Tax=Xiphophorus maculatus TaxID=8083 RepID=A0A3B5R338_XIPMA
MANLSFKTLGTLLCEAVCPGAAPRPTGTLSRLRRPGFEVPEVNALVGRTTVETQIQVLGVAFLHRVSNLLRHAHGEGQVAAHLPDHDGCSDVLGLDLHMLPGNLLHHAQSVGPVAVATILRAVGERCRQIVRFRVVHLLLNAFLVISEDDCQLQGKKKHNLNICGKALP